MTTAEGSTAVVCAVLSALVRGERYESPPRTADGTEVLEDCNLFARQSRFHLIKLLETIALHAYATTI